MMYPVLIPELRKGDRRLAFRVPITSLLTVALLLKALLPSHSS